MIQKKVHQNLTKNLQNEDDVKFFNFTVFIHDYGITLKIKEI